jgi:hypothetical protein
MSSHKLQGGSEFETEALSLFQHSSSRGNLPPSEALFPFLK